ncbi:MAG: hypothetical protein GY771_03410, partial [bacterium]|nr:hypothetical protein [bacterium]
MKDSGSDLERYVPLLDDIYGREVIHNEYTAVLSRKVRYETLFRLVTEIISGYSSEYPLIVVFEDVQWIDPSSKRLIDDLSVIVKNVPVTMIALTRGEEPGLATPGLFPLELTPLSDSVMAKITAGFLPEDYRDDGTINKIVELAKGNPGAAQKYTEAVKLDYGDTGIDNASVNGVVLQTAMQALSDNAESLLQNCITLGTPVKREIIKGVSGLENDEFNSSFDELSDIGVIEALGGVIDIAEGFTNGL